MDLIEPSHFDALVVTSGLPEVLIGSALARAGRSVLLLDPTDCYGASWASLAGPDFIHSLINRQLEHQQKHKQHLQQQPGTTDSIPLQPALQLHSVSGCSLHTHSTLEQALDNKGLIIDLAPKVLYQDEALVQLLVNCQAHNYLEFKLIDGSYIYLSGKLRPVPASRADLFADRLLPLAAKRSLGRFLAACMEAQQGYGRLKDAFNCQPLIDLLVSEGLDEQLQQIVLYGIAMADTPQQQLMQQHAATQQTSIDDGSAESRRSSNDSCLVTAAEGLAAFELYSRSVGRYGGHGAFMAPCYGCGSLPEAFVRLAAVKGAVTALRHGAAQIQLLHQPQQRQQQQQADQCETGVEGSSSAGDSVQAEAGAASKVQVVLSTGQQLTTNAVICCNDAAAVAADAADRIGSSSSHTVACAVALLDASIVEGDSSLLFVFPPRSLGSDQTAVIRGLQLGPAFGVTPLGKYVLYLTAVLPDGCGGGGAAETSNSSSRPEQVLRPALEALASVGGLQVFSFGTDSAEEQSRKPDESQQDTTAGAGVGSESQQQQSQAALWLPQVLAVCYFTSKQAGGYFSSKHQQQECTAQQQPQQQSDCNHLPQSNSSSPGAVLWCPAARQGFMGYDAVVKAAEAAYRQHFPGLPWLTDDVPAKAAAAAAPVPGSSNEAATTGAEAHGGLGDVQHGRPAAGGAGGGGVLEDGELDAIDELTAALLELSGPVEPKQ